MPDPQGVDPQASDPQTLDPEASAVLAELAARAKPMPAAQDAWLRGYREELDAIVAMQGPPPALAVRDEVIEGAPGAPPLELRWYPPESEQVTEPRPTALFIHGGGFVAGTLAGYDIPLRHLALRSGWQIVAVAYRLAPEHPYPAAPDDCAAALRHLLAHAHVDPHRVVVMGDSAGGLLAAVTAAQARRAGIALRQQILLYPNTDLRRNAEYPSRARYDGNIVRLDELSRSLDLYLGTADRTDPDVSPLLADNLAGSCPATVITCACDPLRDDGERFAARLREAGVAVVAERLPGMIHSVFQRGARIAAGDALISRIASRLRDLG